MKAWGLLGLGVLCFELKGVKPGAEDMKSQFYGCSDQGAYIAARPGRRDGARSRRLQVRTIGDQILR